MLDRGSYIPWASRFKRFLNRKRENRKWLLKALEDGPYVFRNITPTGSILPRLQEVEDLQGDDLLPLLKISISIKTIIFVLHIIQKSWQSHSGDRVNLFKAEIMAILQRVNAITAVEKDIMLGIVPKPKAFRDSKYFDGGKCCGWKKLKNLVQTYAYNGQKFNHTIDDDQINSNIQFDSVKGNVNSGSVEKDTHVYDLCALETLARNAYDEAAKQQRFAQKVQQQNMTLTSQIEMYKERNRVLENITKDNNYLKEFLEADERAKRVQKQAESQLYRDRDIIRDLEKQRDKLSQEVKHFKQKNEELQQSHLILKRKMSENEDKYHDTILDLEEKLKKNVDLFLKIGNSLQAMFMLGPKPLSVYDQQLKHGLGYPNPYTLRQAISECPKLYVASRTGNIEIPLNVRDSKETLEDAFKSQQKMNDPIAVANKQNCWTIDYKQLNALYNDFVPQKESFVEQTCSSSSYIPFVKILETKTMPFIGEELLNDLMKLPKVLDKVSLLKVMKDAFEQNDVYLDEIERQNDLLKDQLLKVSLKHDIELCVLLSHECVDKSLHDELQQVKKKSLEIQEGLKARIKILGKDVQRCEKQSVDFELKLQHEKEKHNKKNE
ncbi:hypothetical protein Tco_1031035 [Tanacetum coccineum]|uniref:Uncharacterized protein n=1 Tax=Tanacetum coccineum TaxID=301880 RepID=A0ABQ5G9K2_9ASTR